MSAGYTEVTCMIVRTIFIGFSPNDGRSLNDTVFAITKFQTVVNGDRTIKKNDAGSNKHPDVPDWIILVMI